MGTKADALAARWGLTPHTALHLAMLEELVGPLRVTSGRRSRAANAAAGGVPNSFHLRGRAVDVVPASGTQRAAILRNAPAQRVSAGCTGPEEVLDEGDHIHLAW